MPRQNIWHLRNPGRHHRPDNPVNCPQGKSGFESYEQAEKEDQHRIKALNSVSKDAIAASIGRRDPGELANALERALKNGKLPPTPASKRAMRRMRIQVIGWLVRLYRQESKKASADHLFPSFVTIIPNSKQWIVRGCDLASVDASKLLNELRVDLTRDLGVPQDGWAFFALHGEYDQLRDRWHLHVHGLINGAMIQHVERLRKRYQRKYGAGAPAPNCEDKRCPSVRISKAPPDNLFLRTTYILQSYWPWVLREDPKTGERLPWPKRKRIPEPRHSQLLLWQDRYDFHDLVLLIGLRVQGGNLIRTPNLCTNGDG